MRMFGLGGLQRHSTLLHLDVLLSMSLQTFRLLCLHTYMNTGHHAEAKTCSHTFGGGGTSILSSLALLCTAA